jgi:hypothetical protein
MAAPIAVRMRALSGSRFTASGFPMAAVHEELEQALQPRDSLFSPRFSP